jgi:hypothetical protein
MLTTSDSQTMAKSPGSPVKTSWSADVSPVIAIPELPEVRRSWPGTLAVYACYAILSICFILGQYMKTEHKYAEQLTLNLGCRGRFAVA